jgi:hypothetical protein
MPGARMGPVKQCKFRHPGPKEPCSNCATTFHVRIAKSSTEPPLALPLQTSTHPHPSLKLDWPENIDAMKVAIADELC